MLCCCFSCVVGTEEAEEDKAMVPSTSSPIIQPPIVVETVVQCSKCDQITEYLKTIVSEISALKSSAADDRAEISALKSSNSVLMSSAADDRAKNSAEISALKSTVSTLESSNSVLMSAAADDRAKNSAEISALKSTVSTLESSNSVLKSTVSTLKSSNSVLMSSNSALEVKLADVKDMCTSFENEIADLKTVKKGAKPPNGNNRRLALMMQCVQRRALVTWMRTYIEKKTGAAVPRDEHGLPMWQGFIVQVSGDSAFLKREGLTAKSLLFLNEAVGTDGEASNKSAHDFEKADLAAAISDISLGPHMAYWALYYKKFRSTVV